MPRKPSIRHVPGYGERLKDRLAVAGMTQVELANAAGVSRQTLSRALADDEVSAKTERKIEDALAARAVGPGGSARAVLLPAPDAWVRATDIVAWSVRREAQHELPAVIRDLVRLTVPNVARFRFPSGEGVQSPGWDGQITSPQATPFVPAGDSGWEIGTSALVKEQAETNYEKRTADPEGLIPAQATFVFATSRRWSQKEQWAAEKVREGKWANVRVLDADDLEAWLQDAPSVHLRVSRLIGLFPSGAQDLSYWWENWLGATRPSLTPGFLLSGRAKEAQEIYDTLNKRTDAGPSGEGTPAPVSGEPKRGAVLPIRSESRSESIAVFASTLVLLGKGDEESFARAIVVEDSSAWRTLVASRSRLILIPTFDVGNASAAALRAGHVVILPLGEGDAEVDDEISLPTVRRGEAAAALKEAGLSGESDREKDDRADELSRLARRSMTALRRRLAVASQLKLPSWARPEVARRVVPALLTGSWKDNAAGDRVFLEKLSGKPYGNLADDLNAFAHGEDPALRRRGSVWYLVSREDAWDSLGRFVNDDDVGRFRDGAIEALRAVDPQYNMPADQRWLSGLSDERPAHSRLLRKALAETTALIGARTSGDGTRETAWINAAPSLQYTAQVIVRDVLETANTDWRVWSSLSDVLQEIAEASPDHFLNALDAGLKLEPSPVMKLFEEEGGIFGGSSPHTALLWALERLAWSPAHLLHVVKVLAELARRDPGGKLTNRPAATLKAIFRPWMPQTSVSVEKRFVVLESLAKTHEEIAWDILLGTLPELHGVGFYSARPRWREWDSTTRPVKRGEYEAAVRGTFDRLLKLVGRRGSRWASLIKAVPHLGQRELDLVIEGLDQLSDLDDTDRSGIATALREVVSSHRHFSEARWAMPEESTDKLDSLRSRFEPGDPVAQYTWLYSWHARLSKPKATNEEDRKEYLEELAAERVAAIEDVARKAGVDGMLRIAEAADEASFVGDSAAVAGVLSRDQLKDLVREYVGSSNRHREVFVLSYVGNSLRRGGKNWLSGLLADLGDSVRPTQRGRLLAQAESTPEVWEFAASFGEETERAYWNNIYFVRQDEDVLEAARRMAKFGRADVAADLLGMYAHNKKIDPHLIVDVLKRILAGESADRRLRRDLSYDLGVLLEQAQDAPELDQMEVAKIEWAFLPLLEHRRHPKALFAALSKDPSFFVELVSLVFRAEDEPPKDKDEVSDEDREKASRAYSLLHDWRTLPGSRPDGTIDGEVLMNWVIRTRELLREANRLAIGDQQIGQMLSGSPHDKDGSWPCAAVREVIEKMESDEIERGFAIGKFNSQGVISRRIGEGGQLERAQAEQYEGFAAAVADSSPRTALVLRGMAEDYRRHARREDYEAQLEDDLDE